MDLQEWMKTDSETRKRLINEWMYEPNVLRRNEGAFAKILNEAAAGLAKLLSGIPEVTGIAATAGNSGQLLVTTSLPKGTKVSTIPDLYATFHVLQFGVAEAKKDYLERVEFVCQAAGLSEEVLNQHREFFQQELGNIQSPYYCDTPQKWIAEVLAREKSHGRLTGGELVVFQNAIHEVLATFFRQHDPARGKLSPDSMPSLREALERLF
jgi:hypothetical protein